MTHHTPHTTPRDPAAPTGAAAPSDAAAPAGSAIEWLPAWSRAEGARRAGEVYRRAFDAEPAGHWSAPGRVNVIGEHVDYNGGLCMPMALPHRTYVALTPREDDVVRLVSAQETGVEAWEARLSEVGPRGGENEVTGWGAYVVGVAWALQEAGHPVRGFDAAVDSCVPYGAGLSSSAALEAAFAIALSDSFDLGLGDDDVGRAELAAACIRAENEIAGAPTGGMDQAAALRCQEAHVQLLDCRSGDIEQIPFDTSHAKPPLALLVIDTRAPHELVDGQYGERRASCERAAELLGVDTLREIAAQDLDATLDRLSREVGQPIDVATAAVAAARTDVLRKRVRHVVTEIARVREVTRLLAAGQMAAVGPVLSAAHASLRDDYEVSCPELDVAVEAACAAGALGARMVGGGFGGSAIALIEAAQADQVVASVAQAFADAGFTHPAFALAQPSGPAARDNL